MLRFDGFYICSNGWTIEYPFEGYTDIQLDILLQFFANRTVLYHQIQHFFHPLEIRELIVKRALEYKSDTNFFDYQWLVDLTEISVNHAIIKKMKSSNYIANYFDPSISKYKIEHINQIKMKFVYNTKDDNDKDLEYFIKLSGIVKRDSLDLKSYASVSDYSQFELYEFVPFY